MLVRSLLTLFALPAALALVACPASSGAPDDPAGAGALVVGVQSDDFGGVVDSVHVVAMVDGVAASDQTIPIAATNAKGLPLEVPLTGAINGKVDVSVDGSMGGKIIVSRRAATHLVSGDTKKLLRLQLETRCVTISAPGSTSATAPVCTAPQTCSAGRCIADDVAANQLEDYEPMWASSPPDICRPANHGAPDVILGTGQTDFAPLADGQTLMLEKGPQGGHHIWIAARQKNLRQSGSRTVLSAKLVANPSSAILPAAYVFTFDPDEGNYCKLWGLRFQLDSGATDLAADYKRFLGQKLEVTVEITDSTGASAKSTKTIDIAPLLLCPDGTTTTCN